MKWISMRNETWNMWHMKYQQCIRNEWMSEWEAKKVKIKYFEKAINKQIREGK